MLVHRSNNVFKSVNSSPEFAASYSVYVTPVGARVASAATASTSITVDAGHSFRVNDRFLRYRPSDGSTEFSTPMDSAVSATSLEWLTDTWTVAAGDLLVNLGPDTGTGGTPDYDAIPGRISSQPDDGDDLSNVVTTDSEGNYDYYSRMSGRQWEMIADGSGTIVGLIDGHGGQPFEYNLADFGCRIDGSTSDSGSVLAAVTAMNSLGGNIIHPGGTIAWTAGDSVDLSGTNIGIIGRGDSSVFDFNINSATRPLDVTGTNVVLRDFKITGNRAQTNKANSIHINGATTVTVERVFVDESGAVGINVTNSTDVHVVRCRVDQSQTHGILFQNGSARCTAERNVLTSCCQGEGQTGSLTVLGGDPGSGTTNTISCINNIINDAQTTGLRCTAVSGVYPEDIRFIGNEIDGAGNGAAENAGEGITITCKRGICHGNIVKDANVNGIKTSASSEDIVITGNLVENSSQNTGAVHAAISLVPDTATPVNAMKNVLIVGNTAVDTQTGSETQQRIVSVGVSEDTGTLDHVLITGNTGRGNTQVSPFEIGSDGSPSGADLRPNVFVGMNVTTDSNGDLYPEWGYTQTGITASTTQTQGNGLIYGNVVEVSTVANSGDTVTLPAASAGRSIKILNNGANDLQVFPASGDNIDGIGANSSVFMEIGQAVTFVAYDTTNWRREGLGQLLYGGIVTGITAGTTQTQAGATLLTGSFNRVDTCANVDDGVKLPDAVAGRMVVIRNEGAQACKVYPNTGDFLDGGAVNVGRAMAADKGEIFFAIDSGNWYSISDD